MTIDQATDRQLVEELMRRIGVEPSLSPDYDVTVYGKEQYTDVACLSDDGGKFRNLCWHGGELAFLFNGDDLAAVCLADLP